MDSVSVMMGVVATRWQRKGFQFLALQLGLALANDIAAIDFGVLEYLSFTSGRPINLNRLDGCGLAQPDFLA